VEFITSSKKTKPNLDQVKIQPFSNKVFTCGLLVITTVFAALNTYAQTDTSASHYEGLSLQDLLKVKIVSVSKKAEYLMDAPLSASVVTRQDIERAGCKSLMEAMRLVPGVIVREQSNGNYDIHLRGMDNIPPNASFDLASTTTLVMIDGRPIYSYLRGGTFWETLPIDINDVERIEVVRGPAAALYGPNAVNGVINFITRQIKKQGLYIIANNRQGSNRTYINNASIGYKKGKLSMIASGNFHQMGRSQTSYFEFTRNTWMDHPDYMINFNLDTVRNLDTRYPNQAQAMKKYAGNLFIDYDLGKNIKFDISAGVQNSIVQKISAENEITPLSTAHSLTKYLDFRANVKGVTVQVSFNQGTQSIDYDPGNKYDFNTLHAVVEYNYTSNNLSIKPGLHYTNAVYDDTKYSDLEHRTGIFNGKGKITTISPSLRAEYKLLGNRLRLIGGLTAHKFNYPNTTYISTQLGATHRVNKSHLLRAVYSRAPRSSNIFDTYVDQTIAFFPIGPERFMRMGLWGNKNLKLLTADMYEVGYRGSIGKHFNIDVEVFDIHARNANIMVTDANYERVEGPITIVERPIVSTNLPLKLHQQGITLSLVYSTKTLQIKPFVTLQKTKIKDYAPYNSTPEVGPLNLNSGIGTETTHKSSPSVFGGFTINYVPTSKININLNGYYYSKQTYHHLSNVLFNDGIRGIDTIGAKLLINLTASYEVAKGLHVFVSGKNLLNNKSREFFRADEVPLRVMAGVNFEL
jgi:iron complex outermembrane receptor protein